MEKKEKKLFGMIVGVIIVLMLVVLGFIYYEMQHSNITYHDVSEDGEFSTAFIRKSHSYQNHKNYMISPYSVEIALSMLREGAKKDTLEEFERVVPKRSIKTLMVKNKINVANAIFVKDIYKKDLLPSYEEGLKTDYNADVIYDSFQTPDKINRWVKQETKGMIPKILDQMDPQFVLGIANAVAMEEEWKTAFECDHTQGYAFTKVNGKQYDTAMMYQSFEKVASYYQNSEIESVILPYAMYDRNTGKTVKKNGEQLDFIAILPKDLDSYIEDFTLDDVKEITKNSRKAGERLEITVGLPRFEFSYDFKDFKETLEDMGIQKVFTSSCDLSGMVKNHDGMYVSEAIHKSYVKVNETGTKAAAVTYFGIKDSAAIEDDKEYVSLILDRPFILLIKDHKSNEILFFGVVYEPEKWDEEKTCE